MELKEYQVAALEAFTRWQAVLEKARMKSQVAREALRQAGVSVFPEVNNYPKKAWQELAGTGGVAASAGEYVSRTDEAGRPIAHICFKVPTGGGKTLMAAAALERLHRQTGLTLWITPTSAIYQQTKTALSNREHPCRQLLARGCGGRVKLLEKEDLFTRADLENYLCVMLLMLPAAKRQKGRDFLRMFRDSGRYPSIFPDSDDVFGDARLLCDYPDLERTSTEGPVKRSLFNALKMLRPVVVLDEAHKAYGRQAKANAEFVCSINRLDPSLVIELSATPNRGISNLLVDITGVELKAEEMIKSPVQVTAFPKAEWQRTLGEAHAELTRLDTEAQSLQKDEGRYIRPIAVVRVERTGKDQRDGERVHAEDVREYLIQNLGVSVDAVAIKSSDRDELGRENLLSEFSPRRWIITKSALMEGWDCPFAYVLVMLDNTQAQRAITQLVGRVMRQPHARCTPREALNQCYVFCWKTEVANAVQQIRQGLEEEGLTGLSEDVVTTAPNTRTIEVQRRKPFRDQDIYLPLVLHKAGEQWRELNYQQHILSGIDWSVIAAPDPQHSLLERAKRQTATVYVGDTPPVFHATQEIYTDKTLRISWFARRLSDIVPNPWQATRIAQELVEKLREAGEEDDKIFDQRFYLAFALREWVTEVIEGQAEGIFRRKLKGGEIRFDLESSKHKFRMVEKYEITVAADAGLMARNDGQELQLSLFKPVYVHQFDSNLERNFARYLDEQKALQWWHRVAARQKGDYYLRGWKEARIWPDFLAMGSEENGKQTVLVYETKGNHLRGNPDTDYKHKVLDTLQNAFNCGMMTVCNGPAKGIFRLVFDGQFPEALSSLQQNR